MLGMKAVVEGARSVVLTAATDTIIRRTTRALRMWIRSTIITTINVDRVGTARFRPLRMRLLRWILLAIRGGEVVPCFLWRFCLYLGCIWYRASMK